jgi:hypothetical protein
MSPPLPWESPVWTQHPLFFPLATVSPEVGMGGEAESLMYIVGVGLDVVAISLWLLASCHCIKISSCHVSGVTHMSP